MAAVFQVADGVQIGAAGALRGYKDTRAPMQWRLQRPVSRITRAGVRHKPFSQSNRWSRKPA